MKKNNDDFADNLLGLIGSDKFRSFATNLENLFSEADFQPIDEEDVYSQLVDNYFKLIKKLKIKEFSTFAFYDYDDSRIVVIDGKKYDFDTFFSHNNSSVTEILCGIDNLIADIGKELSFILKEIEKRITG